MDLRVIILNICRCALKGEEKVKHKQRTAVTRLREFIDKVKNDESLNNELVDIGDGILVITKK